MADEQTQEKKVQLRDMKIIQGGTDAIKGGKLVDGSDELSPNADDALGKAAEKVTRRF